MHNQSGPALTHREQHRSMTETNPLQRAARHASCHGETPVIQYCRAVMSGFPLTPGLLRTGLLHESAGIFLRSPPDG